MRQIHIFGKGYLEALPSRRSASSHSRRLSIEQHIFPQRVLGYKTHLLEIYVSPTTLTPHFFYLCYSLKPTARGEWLGYISEGWRGFLQGIDQKPKAVLSCSFSSYRSGPPEWFSVEDQLKSRRQSRAVLFRVIAAGRLGSLAVGVERQLKAAWHEHLFGVHLRTLAGLFVGD